MKKYRLDCRFFTGYKPCLPGKICSDCNDYSPMGTRILIINLDALGDVLRTTSILYPVKRKYKNSHISWLTDKSALPLLENNPHIDRILEYSYEDALALQIEKFDVLMNADKSRRSGSLANLINAKDKFGFGLTETGAIYPLDKEAMHLYEVGLDDKKKFKENKKSAQQLLCEAMKLEYTRDEYILNLTAEEKEFVKDYRKTLGLKKEDIVVGFNTGCSNLYPYKKMPLKKQIELIDSLFCSIEAIKIALLGGREDIENNAKLEKYFKNRLISTPTDMGLRKGILFIDACDIIISGDTLAMHVAIALKKSIVVWFSITCENEIELYGRGVKVISKVKCRPCWKRSCSNLPRCNEMVDITKICDSVKKLTE